VSHDIELEVGTQDAEAVARLLRALPDWFGIESATQSYIEDARTFPTVLARADGQVVGALLWSRRYPESAEVHLMAVEPSYHRRGIGRRLLERAEEELRSDGVRFLQVKTLGPSSPDENYARTRRFYAGCGFVPLEELHGVWSEGNPMLILVKAL
jgi:GNAT superfamily N-acetyltransferase